MQASRKRPASGRDDDDDAGRPRQPNRSEKVARRVPVGNLEPCAGPPDEPGPRRTENGVWEGTHHRRYSVAGGQSSAVLSASGRAFVVACPRDLYFSWVTEQGTIEAQVSEDLCGIELSAWGFTHVDRWGGYIILSGRALVAVLDAEALDRNATAPDVWVATVPEFNAHHRVMEFSTAPFFGPPSEALADLVYHAPRAYEIVTVADTAMDVDSDATASHPLRRSPGMMDLSGDRGAALCAALEHLAITSEGPVEPREFDPTTIFTAVSKGALCMRAAFIPGRPVPTTLAILYDDDLASLLIYSTDAPDSLMLTFKKQVYGVRAMAVAPGWVYVVLSSDNDRVRGYACTPNSCTLAMCWNLEKYITHLTVIDNDVYVSYDNKTFFTLAGHQ